ncbi:hypothetical protein [Thalassotalea sp. PLHSN55]|uniref:hypothetical protein n=1 Tax=Thalassotalea sp. PLHSN55 TaxID=3435888 RepID=UPI003F87E441
MTHESKDEPLFDSLMGWVLSKNLIKQALILAVVALLTIAFFFTVLAKAFFTKLDAHTEYSIQAETQIVSYSPVETSIQDTNLGKFKLYDTIDNCAKLVKGEWYEKGELKVYKDSLVNLLFIPPNTIEIGINAPSGERTKVAQLISKKGRCEIKQDVTIDVELNENQKKFIMFMVGDVTIGSPLSYATETMPPLLKSGEIQVKDKSFIFEDSISLPSTILSTGDTAILSSNQSKKAMGMVIANLDAEYMDTVFRREGGEIRIVKPFAPNEGTPISISFFERIYSDNVLAIVLSASIVVLHLLMYLVTTLIRLSFAAKSNSDEKQREE